MAKVVFVAIGVILVLLVGGWFLLLPHGTSATSTQATTVPKQVTTTIPPSTVPITTTIYGGNATGCLSKNATQPILNGNFSTGTYLGWTPTDLGFGTMPANITYLDQNNGYYGQPWSGWNGTYFATTYSGGTSFATGNLTSAPFLVTEPYLNFKIISAQSNGLYVEILKNNVPQIIAHYNTYAVPVANATNSSETVSSNSNFFNASLVMVPLLCNKVQIRIVGATVGINNNQFQYIAATGFYQSKKAIQTPAVIVNQTYKFS